MRAFILTLLLMVTGNAFSQDFQIGAHLGVGNVIGNEFARGKYAIYLQPMFNLSEVYSLGAELGTGNTLFPGDALVENEDMVNINGLDSRFTFFHIQNKFSLRGGKIGKYLGFGIGTTQLNVEVNEPQVISNDDFHQWNFSFNAEAGLRFKDYEVGLKYLFAGDSPSFRGQTNDATNRDVLLQAQTTHIIMLTVGYVIDFAKVKN